MFASMVIVGVIVAKFQHDWPHHVAAGWTAVGQYQVPARFSYLEEDN